MPDDRTLFGQTPWQTAGPFFHVGLPWPGCDDLADDDPDAIALHGRLSDGAGDPVPDAMIETWQAASARQAPAAFGRACTNEDGVWRLRTRRPGPGTQAPHIALGILGRGLIRRLVTRLYFEDAPENGDDPVLALVPPDRRRTLIARRDGPGWRFDIVLQGPGETVFFEV